MAKDNNNGTYKCHDIEWFEGEACLECEHRAYKKQMKKLIKAWETAIEDLKQDIGWKPRAKRKVLAAMEHRLWELKNWEAFEAVILDESL